MAAPPAPALGPLTYLVIRSLVRDLPEDFLARIEVGIDDAVKPALERGLRAARVGNRLMSAAIWILIVGGATVVLSIFAWRWSPDTAAMLLYAGVVCGSLAAVGILAAGAISLLRRGDLRLLHTYVEAARRSSLARDLE